KSDSLPYSVTIENRASHSGWKIKSQFNGSAEYPKGWVYYFNDAPLDIKTDSLELLVFFEKAQTYRTMDIQIDRKLLVSNKDLAQSFKYSWFEKNGIIHLSGSSYHPFMDSILTNVKGYCYSYTAVIDTQNNLSKVNLGVPPADYNDTLLLFTDYGIANIYGNYFISYEIPLLNDSLKMILATSYKDSLTVEQIYYHLYTYNLVSQILGKLKTDTSVTAIEFYINQDVHLLSDSLKRILATSYMNNLTVSEIIFRIIINPSYILKPASAIDSITVEEMQLFISLNYKYVDGSFTLHDPSEVAQMKVDDLKYFLTLNTTVINPKVKLLYKTLLWILKLEQPVYFNSNGYAGNGSIIPIGFEELSKIQCNRTLFKPLDVKKLVIEVE
ncbi:MAG: hypothetical protein PVI26_14575, partial [Chitinispirillia bacterium]